MIKDKLAILPQSPGCYLMKDKIGTIIYVGKAKNLKNRVRSYFIGAHNDKTTLLVKEIVDFEYIITDSELEALVLEINLIKKHLPKYNIDLVDDKTYPYILLTKEKHPRLLVVRGLKNNKNGRYFGPYPNVLAARNTAKLINTLYPFRKCHKMPKESCLYYHINQCLAPCIKKIDYDYQEEITKVVQFLKGNTTDVIKMLEQRMYESSASLEFEKALEYKNLLLSIKDTTEKQKIVINDFIAKDIVGISYNAENISFEILYMRQGQIVQNYKTIIPYIGDLDEAISSFLAQFYNDPKSRPKEILLSKEYNVDLLNEYLGLKIIYPIKGAKNNLVEMANANALNNLENKYLLLENKALRNQNNIYKLAELLNIELPIVIEAFDNSNLMGEYPISAMVVYKAGIKQPKLYRKYHLRTIDDQNDYQSMKEVIYRRYYRLLIEGEPLPNLILTDGGKIQVNAALEILGELNLNIAVAGLKKNDKHQLESIYYNDKDYIISKNDDLYLFLASISQTVHEYAISFFRSKKAKGMFSSLLDGISGLGPKKKEKLLKTYLTIDTIKNLSIAQFREIGINEELAIRILTHLNPANA